MAAMKPAKSKLLETFIQKSPIEKPKIKNMSKFAKMSKSFKKKKASIGPKTYSYQG